MVLLSKLNEAGTTIIMVTHSPAYTEYGNRVVHLFDGHIVTENMKGKFHV
jgi:putative ABC transport system ATP-binding protein